MIILIEHVQQGCTKAGYVCNYVCMYLNISSRKVMFGGGLRAGRRKTNKWFGHLPRRPGRLSAPLSYRGI